MQSYTVALAALQVYDYWLTLSGEVSFGWGSSEGRALTEGLDSIRLEGS